MTRQECLDLLHEYTKTESLRTHALAVEAAMRAYARSFGEDEEAWGAVGLLHDFDYEQNQQVPDHPMKGLGDPQRARLSGRVAARDHLARSGDECAARLEDGADLFACDELCGFIVAVAVIRPNKIADLEVSSVKKKLKDKAFARSVSREDILQGAAEAGFVMDDHIRFVIVALKPVAPQLGLA